MSPQAAISYAASVTTRYKDAYRVAKTLNFLGMLCKIVAAILAIIALVVLVEIGSQYHAYYQFFNTVIQGRDLWWWYGFGAAAVIFGVGWIIGVFISAQGQLIKATIDSAVNTSPFISETQKADVMSLS